MLVIGEMVTLDDGREAVIVEVCAEPRLGLYVVEDTRTHQLEHAWSRQLRKPPLILG